MSFQEVQLLRRNVLNVMESKTKRAPFFLPKMKLNQTSTTCDKDQQPDIELDVRGLGETDTKGFVKKGKRKQKGTKKHKNKTDKFSSPSNRTTGHKTPRFSLPPIDSKSLTHQRLKSALSCSSTKSITPQQEFEIAFNTLTNVIERGKQEQKRTTERFQRNIVQGEQKPINKKLHSPVRVKSTCSPEKMVEN